MPEETNTALRDSTPIEMPSPEDVGTTYSFSEGAKTGAVDPTYLESEVYKQFNELDMAAINERDELFNDFLSDFILGFRKKEEEKRKLKKAFFIWIMIIFSAIILAPTVCVIVSFFTPSSSIWSVLSVILSGLIEIVIAFLVLPKIIAEYLFNQKEDSDLLTIVSNMQEYNSSGHDRINNNHKPYK